jgi:hypothetical protein
MIETHLNCLTPRPPRRRHPPYDTSWIGAAYLLEVYTAIQQIPFATTTVVYDRFANPTNQSVSKHISIAYHQDDDDDTLYMMNLGLQRPLEVYISIRQIPLQQRRSSTIDSHIRPIREFRNVIVVVEKAIPFAIVFIGSIISSSSWFGQLINSVKSKAIIQLHIYHFYCC